MEKETLQRYGTVMGNAEKGPKGPWLKKYKFFAYEKLELRYYKLDTINDPKGPKYNTQEEWGIRRILIIQNFSHFFRDAHKSIPEEE